MSLYVDWSRLLDDPDWITKCQSQINRVIGVAQAIDRARSVPLVRQHLLESDWMQAICDLKAHVQVAVDDAIREMALDCVASREVAEAFELIAGAMEHWCPFTDDGEMFTIPSSPYPDFVGTLESAAKLLSQWQTPPPPWEDEQPAAVDASGSKTPEAPAIDYAAVANKLAARRKPTQAALVRFMKDKDAAPFDDVAHTVHGNSDASEKAVAKNAERTSDSLAELDCPVLFRLAGGLMHKEISPE